MNNSRQNTFPTSQEMELSNLGLLSTEARQSLLYRISGSSLAPRTGAKPTW